MKIRVDVEVEIPDGEFCCVDGDRKCSFAYISHAISDHCGLFNVGLNRSYFFPVGGGKIIRTHKCDQCRSKGKGVEDVFYRLRQEHFEERMQDEDFRKEYEALDPAVWYISQTAMQECADRLTDFLNTEIHENYGHEIYDSLSSDLSTLVAIARRAYRT